MFHYNLSILSVSFYFFYFFFPNEKANTRKNNTGILFPYVVPFSMKIDGRDEQLFVDSLPRLLTNVSSQFLLTPKAVHEPVTSLWSPLGSALVKQCR